jgi:hypothetical protein
LLKHLAFALALLPATALAQQAPDCPLQLQAMGGALSDQIQSGLTWRMKYLQDEQKIAQLQAEIDQLKKTDPPKK